MSRSLGALVALVVILLLALLAILLVSPGTDGASRLALFFGILATVIPALIAAIRGEQAHRALNGALDARLEDAVLRANARRRSTDREGEG